MHRLASLLPDGVALRSAVTSATSSSSVSRWLARGDVLLLHPGVLALPDGADDWEVRLRAAALWAGGPPSHLSAVAAAGLAPRALPLHVMVPHAQNPRCDAADVLVHRTLRRPATIRCGPLDVVEPTRSLVDAWVWVHSPASNPRARIEAAVVRQAVIEGVRVRAVRCSALRRESDRRPSHAGRAALVQLLDLMDGGCQSELEIWGVTRVLPGPPLVPGWVQQHAVRLGDGRRVLLDAAYLGALVAVELDGAAFHGSREARERDLRRDSALASLGWVVLRFSYERLMRDPEGCRAEIIAVIHRRLVRR